MVPVAVAFNHFKKFLLAFHRRGQVRFRTRGVNRALTQEKNRHSVLFAMKFSKLLQHFSLILQFREQLHNFERNRVNITILYSSKSQGSADTDVVHNVTLSQNFQFSSELEEILSSLITERPCTFT